MVITFAFMCLVRLSEQTVTFSLYIVNKFINITEVESVYCAVRTESLYNTDTSRPLQIKDNYNSEDISTENE
jgi:hypothetical protein